MLEGKKVAIIGAGVMGEVLIKGLVDSKLVEPADVMASHYRAERQEELAGRFGIQTTGDNAAACRFSDVAVLCVRPQGMDGVLQEIADSVAPDKAFTSIAAGLPIAMYERTLGEGTPFIRAMPTFFGAIREGTTGLALNAATGAEDLATVSRLFGTISRNVVVLPESEMDAFTTFGSTTTATVYLLLDALITAGSLIGLRHQASHSRAIEQVVGAAQNVAATNKLPSQLLDEICTPGGVTVEGVKVLESRAARAAIIDGVLAATDRARDLANK